MFDDLDSLSSNSDRVAFASLQRRYAIHGKRRFQSQFCMSVKREKGLLERAYLGDGRSGDKPGCRKARQMLANLTRGLLKMHREQRRLSSGFAL